MPELAEVEASRRLMESFCVGSTIETVNTRETGGGPKDGQFDDIVFENKSGADVERAYGEALLNKTVVRVDRKGKQMWLQFSGQQDNCILFHFGMTGSIVIKDQQVARYRSFKVDSNWPPKFTKLLLGFSNGTQLAFCDPRRLARIRLAADPLLCSPVKDLALDPSTEPLPEADALLHTFASISTSIKAVLLDQERIFCGLGNYMVDEILYQAGIHPSTPCNRLSPAGVTTLLAAVEYVVKTAIQANAEYADFPADWLFLCRWDKVRSKSESVRMPDGNAVVFEVVAGRTTAIVPHKQPRTGPLVMPAARTVHSDNQNSSSAVANKRKAPLKEERAKQTAVVVAATSASSSSNSSKIQLSNVVISKRTRSSTLSTTSIPHSTGGGGNNELTFKEEGRKLRRKV